MKRASKRRGGLAGNEHGKKIAKLFGGGSRGHP